jgi:hypothetical protein
MSQQCRQTYEWLNDMWRNAYKAWAKSLALAQELGMPYDEGLSHLERSAADWEMARRQMKGRGPRSIWCACELFTELGAKFDLGQAQAELDW